MILDQRVFETEDRDTILGVFGQQGDGFDIFLYDFSDCCDVEAIHLSIHSLYGGQKIVLDLAKCLIDMKGGDFEDRFDTVSIRFETWKGSHNKEYLGMDLKRKSKIHDIEQNIYITEVEPAFCRALGEWLEYKVEEAV